MPEEFPPSSEDVLVAIRKEQVLRLKAREVEMDPDAWRKAELVELLEKAQMQLRIQPHANTRGTPEASASEDSLQLRQQLVVLQQQLDEANAARQEEVGILQLRGMLKSYSPISVPLFLRLKRQQRKQGRGYQQRVWCAGN